jgi:K+-transporting ATPase ATPase A chain
MLMTELLGMALMFVLAVALAIPLGKYIAKVYQGEKTLLDKAFNPFERLIFKLAGIDPKLEMTWKEHLKALLTLNFLWFFFAMCILMCQGYLPLNPDGNPNMSPDLAFNTAISFLVNCNLQHYSGETGLSYLSQIVVHHVPAICDGRHRNGRRGCGFQCHERPRNQELGQFLPLLPQVLYAHPPAHFLHRGHPLGLQWHPDDI